MMTHAIFGLGNPGDEYENTRHNVGKMAVQHLGAAHEAQFRSVAKTLRQANISFRGVPCVLFYPLIFMNDAGRAVKKVLSRKDAERLIVIHDELDLPIGRCKVSFGSGSGGHKGVESIITTLGTKNFWRIKIGIAPLNASGQAKKFKDKDRVSRFVLGRLTPKEGILLEGAFSILEREIEAICLQKKLPPPLS